MTVGIVTAIYDGYDELHPCPPQRFLGGVAAAIDAVCVTDDPDLRALGWRMVYEPRPGVHPNLAAKRPKMLPWEYLSGDCAASIWIDGAFRITSQRFATEAMDFTFHGQGIAQFVHPWRDCVFDEALASLGIPKYAGLPLAEQVNSYEDHPPSWGLWATGCIARRHTDAIIKFGEDWLAECERWTFHDQLSEAPVLRRHGLRPTRLPGNHLRNPWLVHEGSERHNDG